MSADEHPVISPKKLIEVALPLDAINKAAAKEKSIRHGHPSTLHLWWARRPLAAARAVIFSQLVNDPEDLWWHQNPGAVPNKQVRGHWTKARKRLFEIIEELVLWENTTNEEVLERAREEIRKSWREVCELNKAHPQATELFNPDKMPGLHDPFAGGGAIPLEAQRLGLEAYASDLNPVAVLINKAMIEIPPKFAGRPPVHPDARKDKKLFNKEWKGAEGLAEDVRRYGQWMRDEAKKRIGHLYPKVEITAEMAKERPDLKPFVGEKLTVIAWIWARSVKSPNPAFSHIEVPLASTFVLSDREGTEAYVVPEVRRDGYRLTVAAGRPPDEAAEGTKLARGAKFRCLLSNTAIDPDYVKEEASHGRMGAKLMAVVADGPKGRVFLPPSARHEEVAAGVDANDARGAIHLGIAEDPRPMTCLLYGMTHFDELFTSRQLQGLSTFASLINEVRAMVQSDASRVSPHAEDSKGDLSYPDAVATYLAMCVSKASDLNNALCGWKVDAQCPVHLFGRQAIPIIWDFAEANLLSESTCSWLSVHQNLVRSMSPACLPAIPGGHRAQQASALELDGARRFISTDPPYYDNIGYADLSDFFYVWLRPSLRHTFPDLFSTMAVPKAEELVAAAYRHGSKSKAEQFFMQGMTAAMRRLSEALHPSAPLTLYYAFKQSETKGDLTNSAGWETFLEAVLAAGLAINGTWPVRTEQANRMRSLASNALASSVVLVCRPRSGSAGTVSRRQFVRLLNETLPEALAKITGADEGEHSPVAPVDLSQAIIGPGMAIFSRYDAVLEADGTPMTVKTALQLINRFLAEDDFDGDTQFCLHWFEQHGWEKGKFGEADTLARAKGTSVDGVRAAGVIESGGGNVRLLKWKEYPADWNPSLDTRLPVWEALHQLIRAYSSKGDAGAGKVLKACAGKAEAARQLAYRLYTLCERKGWAEDARAYNDIVTGWSGIERAAGTGGEDQKSLFE
jgi:putative DNA methylase